MYVNYFYDPVIKYSWQRALTDSQLHPIDSHRRVHFIRHAFHTHRELNQQGQILHFGCIVLQKQICFLFIISIIFIINIVISYLFFFAMPAVSLESRVIPTTAQI